MRAPPLTVPARFWAWALGRRIQFRDAVPVRQDRRELRHRFRRAERAASAERKAALIAVLRRLSAEQAKVSAVALEPPGGGVIVGFQDGTRLRFDLRYGTADLQCLGRELPRVPAWLVQARPCFGRAWFRLWFASAQATDLTEVLARVTTRSAAREPGP